MRDKLRWLAVPPALALLLMFGPWRTASPRPLERVATGVEANKDGPVRPPLVNAPAVATPDLTQVLCTVLGVCLLGAAVVLGLARARTRAPGNGAVIVLRQSVRLSNRHSMHAVEFADRLLLVGECDGSLRVLHAGDDAEAPATTRAAGAADESDDGGAVLKDMVIPRPPRSGDAAASARSPREPGGRGLADFRTLLGKTQVHG